MLVLRLVREWKLEIVAFLTGASVMVLEITGARLVTPQFGASTYVWTAMIGVILGSLAVGYAIGGKLADRYHSSDLLAMELFLAAVGVFVMAMIQEPTLANIASLGWDVRLGALLAAVALFGLPSLMIGMVSPHLAKLRVTDLESTGRSIGRLEAAGALGSIAGTFSCGYFLLGAFGSRSIVMGIVALLLLTSFLVNSFFWRKLRMYAIGAVVVGLLLANVNPPHVLADVDSSYSRYQVIRSSYGATPAHLLITDNNGIQSAVPADGSETLLFNYVQRFYQAAQAYGTPDRVLVIGGGTYTFPSALARNFPQTAIDAVEIDPKLDELAQRYFYLTDSPRLNIHHDDGRSYLNQTTQKYDLLYMDAFSSLSPPFQLTTREAIGRVAGALTDDGAVVANVVGRYQDGRGEYLRALMATYQTAFKYVSLHTANPNVDDSDARQNYLLYASNSRPAYDRLVADAGPRLTFIGQPGLVLTDDYAPIERLTF